MTQNGLNAVWNNGSLILSGDEMSRASETSTNWKAVKVDANRYFVADFVQGSDIKSAQGFGKFSTDMIYDLIVGLHNRNWTGMIFIDTGFGRKKLFFNSGELVFAASDLIDDRLGEVIYRDGVITLDQLTEFAVQVDRKSKFGQVLLRSGKFSNIDLWNALKSQINEIFKSVFLVDTSYLELQSTTAPVEVIFEEGLIALLDSAYSFGAQFRSFRRRVHEQVKILPIENPIQNHTGTFAGDVMELCKDSPFIGDVIHRSKLMEINTLSTIHSFVANGRLKLEGMHEPDIVSLDGSFGNLKSKIDAYQVLHSVALASFQNCKMPFPVNELHNFAVSLNRNSSRSIFLDDNGALSAESVANILQQCIATSHRLEYFQIRMESLIRYLVQMGLDMLPFDGSKDLKSAFREMAS